MRVIDSLYSQSPVFVQNITISAYGYYWKKRRFGGVFENQLEKFKERELYRKSQWLEYQNTELNKLLLHAYDKIEFYRHKFSEIGINKDDLNKISVETIAKLPILSKQELRKFGKNKLLSNQKESKGRFYASSGSTGTPTQILFSFSMHQRWSAAFETRIRHWSGVDKDTPRGMIGGRRVVPNGKSKSPFYRYNSAERQTYFSAYHISDETSEDYLNGIRKHGVRYMTGYAFSNYSLAKFFKQEGLKVPPMDAVITSSEKLTPAMRSLLEEVYQCKAYDSYSGLEACGLISECEHGSLHISPDVGILEIIKDDGSYAEPGEEGELICTGLLNYDQPLIRYQIGDRVRLSKDQSCGCGREMPMVDEILGRNEDIIKGPDGREMVRFHGIFIDLPNLVEGQIVQKQLDHIVVNTVSSGNLSSEERDIMKKRLVSQLGDISVFIHEVDEIPRGPNGKFQAVISEID